MLNASPQILGDDVEAAVRLRLSVLSGLGIPHHAGLYGPFARDVDQYCESLALNRLDTLVERWSAFGTSRVDLDLHVAAEVCNQCEHIDGHG